MVIESARNTDGEQPAHEFLLKLINSRRLRRRRLATDAMALFEEWAQVGRLEIPLQQRQLRDELWEVKTSALRFPYYEDRDSTHGRYARLTHGFEKDIGKTREGKTPRHHIDLGLWMIREDRAC